MTRTILLDCDGVLADFMGHVIASTHGVSRESMVHWDFMPDIPEDQQGVLSEAMQTWEWWKHILPIDRAKYGVQYMRQHDCKVVCVTTPWPSCDMWESTRRGWLDLNFAPIYGTEIIITDNKTAVDGDVFVDDKPESVALWAAAHPNKLALLFDAPYNQESDLPRCMGWDDLMAQLFPNYAVQT